MANILLKNGTFLTMDDTDTFIENGYCIIKDDTIVEIGTIDNLEENSDFSSYTIIDCKDKIIMPGMVNTHAHQSMIIFRTLGDDVDNRLQRYLFPLERNTMTPEMVYDGANYAFAESILGGVTTVYDAYYFEDQVALSADKCGIRAVLSDTIINTIHPCGTSSQDGINLTKNFIEKWKNHSLVTPAVNCHAIYTNSTETLKECHQIARDNDLLMCMHVSEMPYEIESCKNEHNMTPIEYLDSIGVLDDKFLAAHCIVTTDNDLEILKSRNVKVSHCIGSNTKGGKSIPRIADMCEKGITVSIGTDGGVSGNTIDLLTQLSQVAKFQKVSQNNQTIFKSKQVLKMATIEGAKSLLLDHLIGSLEVGKKADIIVFETDSINMKPVYDPYSAIVYSANPSNVETTIVNGQILMHKRELLTIDKKEITDKLLSHFNNIREAAKEIDRTVDNI